MRTDATRSSSKHLGSPGAPISRCLGEEDLSASRPFNTYPSSVCGGGSRCAVGFAKAAAIRYRERARAAADLWCVRLHRLRLRPRQGDPVGSVSGRPEIACRERGETSARASTTSRTRSSCCPPRRTTIASVGRRSTTSTTTASCRDTRPAGRWARATSFARRAVFRACSRSATTRAHHREERPDDADGGCRQRDGQTPCGNSRA